MNRLSITVRGVVQGVGFRPFVYHAALARGLTGWVRNESGTVQIEVQGDRSSLDSFVDALRHNPPPQAHIDAVEIEEIRIGEDVLFEILTSEGTSSPRPSIPADLATCDECLAEIFDASQRRYNYPFTNCTRCGPRWSIIQRLPYDRPSTSMAAFEMCPACRAEYENPADRRFHAQPIACPRCGPTLQLLDGNGLETARGEAALTATVQSLLAGQIVALKGLGGFQLLVDATHADAVALLRRRKRRPDRPFALMMASLEDLRRYCECSAEEAKELSSHQAPIVLLRKLEEDVSLLAASRREDAAAKQSRLCNGVAPGNPYLGVMLPYTPLHHLLMAAFQRPLVCTSGNLSEEPMAISIEDARGRLGAIADVILTHDRPIVRPVDDSIVRIGIDGPQVLRRARGFAPLPIEIAHAGTGPFFGERKHLCEQTPAENMDLSPWVEFRARPLPTILAVGGHLKNTVALLLGKERASTHPAQVVMSAHVGDLDNVLSVEVFRRAIDDLLEFFQAKPDAVVCDLHPDYASTRHAEQLSSRWNVPLVRVQHHHAHVAACMAEHGLRGPVLGFSWDGTGYGPDGTIWGGEALLCEGAVFRREAHLRTFALPGGDRAAREPRRSALGLLYEIFGEQAKEHAAEWFNAGEMDTLLSMLTRGVNTPRTSSMGRLFDAVAALCGLPPVITFEGQAAMALEFAADENEQEVYPLPIIHDGDQPLTVDWAPLIRGVLADRAKGVPISRIGARFHNALANMALGIARFIAPERPIVLTGGCFQNVLLTSRVRSRLSEAGFRVYTHTRVPPGDGGIALGQTLLALLQLQGSFDVSRNPR